MNLDEFFEELLEIVDGFSPFTEKIRDLIIKYKIMNNDE